MQLKRVRYELQDILSGTGAVRHGELIQTVACYLRASSPTISVAKTDKHFKEKETEKLISFIDRHQLWIDDIDFSLFISAGAEQRVYIDDGKHVIKLNDTIYFLSWEDYFNNLLLNNYFFPDTSYQLTGFYKQDNTLFAVVKQAFIKADTHTDLTLVKIFMENNGFLNTRNNDYYHPKLGIIIEDLHDENVLTQNEMLYFIDTVFYIKSDIFWKNS